MTALRYPPLLLAVATTVLGVLVMAGVASLVITGLASPSVTAVSAALFLFVLATATAVLRGRDAVV